MAKKGYPGLVLVPPSDRTILRRRLLRWALFIIAVIWCASTLTRWLPSSNDSPNCAPGVGEQASSSSSEKCGQPQSVTEPLLSQNKFSLTQVSQAKGLSDSQNSPPAGPPPDLDWPATELSHDQVLRPTPSEAPSLPIDRKITAPDTEKSPSSSPLSKPVETSDADVHLADRLATPNNHDQGSKPKSFDPPNGFSDHHVAPPGNEKLAPSLSASRPTKTPGVDARLAEQGDAFAQYRLGRFYAQRDGRQTPEAVSWYKKASPGLHRLAQTGNGQAMYILGVMYAYGRGVARNTEHARHWLSRAVEQKVTAAQPVLTSLDKPRGTDHQSKVSEQAKSTTREN
jgi:hypothetical protein